MTSTIITKNSSTASAVPLAADLTQGELAVNVTDKKLYTKNASGTVVQIGGTGDVVGPASATANGIALFNSTTGKLIKDSAASDGLIYGVTVGRGAGAVASNTAVGASALQANTAGNNTALGYQAGYTNTTGADITAVGYQALLLSTGNWNTAVGKSALAANTTGETNTAVGRGALSANTTAAGNSALGVSALRDNTTGASNVAIGQSALQANTTASNNTAVGYQAGYSNTTSIESTYIGHAAGYSTTGASNTFIGQGAGYSVTSGVKNTILGKFTGNVGGLDIRTASNYIVLSDGDGNPRGYSDSNGSWNFGAATTGNTVDGTVFLRGSSASGYGAYICGLSNGSAAFYIGTYSGIIGGVNKFLTCQNTSGGVYLNGASATSWTAVSDETRKVIIEPITDAANKVSTLRAVIGRLKTDDESVRRPYLIAQDVQAVLPEAVSENEDKEGVVLGLSYTEVIPLLVAAIKELKAEIDILKGNV